MSRIIDADALRAKMYHEAFETDSEMQKWDSGRWIRYKLFENCIDEQPTLSPDEVRGVGRWLHTSDEFGTYEKCSCCGKEYYCGPIAPFNYCPSCGARMTRAEAEKAMEVRE